MRFVPALLACLVLIGAPQASWGQTPSRVGITLGVNRATLSAPGAATAPSGQFAFTGGLVAQLASVGPVSVRPELLLSQKGGSIETAQGGLQYSAGYIEVPLLLRADAPTVGPVTPYGMAGGFGAIKVFERQQPSEGNLNIGIDTGASFFGRYDTGLLAGAGFRLGLGTRPLTLVVRRSWGLIDVAQPPADQPFREVAPFPSSARTRTWTLLVRLGL